MNSLIVCFYSCRLCPHPQCGRMWQCAHNKNNNNNNPNRGEISLHSGPCLFEAPSTRRHLGTPVSACMRLHSETFRYIPENAQLPSLLWLKQQRQKRLCWPSHSYSTYPNCIFRLTYLICFFCFVCFFKLQTGNDNVVFFSRPITRLIIF